MKTLTLKVPDGLLIEIVSEARARNLSNSEIVRERLTRKASATSKAHAPSLWSKMEDLVSHQDSLPHDLARSKKHMTGYGQKRSHR